MKSQVEQQRIEEAVRSNRFAKPGEVASGTKILFDIATGSDQRWVDGTVVGRSAENTACLDVTDDRNRVCVVHWSRTRLLLPPQPSNLALNRIRHVLQGASWNQEYVRVRQEDLRELEKLAAKGAASR